jgi:hypothetical protein
MKKKAPTKRKTKDSYNPAEWDFSKSTEVTPEKKNASGISTSIRLPREMVQKLRKVAQKKEGSDTKPSSKSGLLKDSNRNQLKAGEPSRHHRQ